MQQQQQQELQLADYIKNTYSPDTQTRQSAEAYLNTARDTNPALYFELLLNIIENKHSFYGLEQRQSASVLLKQGLDNREQLTHYGEHIKERVFEQSFREQTQQIYSQLSLILSRLVRGLYPTKWPNILNSLCDIVHTQAVPLQQQYRALDLLNQAVKAISTMRIGPGPRHFTSSGASARILSMVHAVFLKYASDTSVVGRSTALLAMKVARSTSLCGVTDYGASAELASLFKDMFTLTSALIQSGNAQDATTIEFSTKVIQSVLKTLRKLMKKRPNSFVPYLRSTLDLAAAAIRADVPCCRCERTAILAYRLIAQVLVRSADKGYKLELYRGGAQAPEWLVSGNNTLKSFFTPEFLREFITISITRHMVLTEAELVQSVEDPEAFMELEEAGSYKTSRAACVQHALSVVLEAFPGAFSAPLAEFLSDALAVRPASLQAVLAKDAVYAAVGVAAYGLSDTIPFDQVIPRWIEEIAYVDPAYASIARRRLAWLLGNVINTSTQNPPLEMAYKFLVPLLSDPDLSVAFTAAASIHSLVDNLFDINEFNPFADACIKGLFLLLLNRAEQVESKLRIINTICVIAQQPCAGVVASAGIIAEGLGETWKRSEGSEDETIKLKIVSCFTYLAMSIGYDEKASLSISAQIAPYIISLIQTVHNDPNVFIFLNDTLELWYTFLHHTPIFADNILQLCVTGKLDAIIEIATDEEKLTYVSRILSAYFLLANPSFASSPAADALVTAVIKVYPSLNVRGIAYLLRPFATMFRVAESISTAGKALVEKLFTDLDTFAGADMPDAIVAALTVLSRAIINEKAGLVPMLCANTVLLSKFISVAINALDSVSSVQVKKLIALALYALTVKAGECGVAGTSTLVQDVKPHLEGVTAEIKALGGMEAIADNSSDESYIVDGSAVYVAMQNLRKTDPVYTVNLE